MARSRLAPRGKSSIVLPTTQAASTRRADAQWMARAAAPWGSMSTGAAILRALRSAVAAGDGARARVHVEAHAAPLGVGGLHLPAPVLPVEFADRPVAGSADGGDRRCGVHARGGDGAVLFGPTGVAIGRLGRREGHRGGQGQ